MMWTVPRSISTVLCKCLSYVEDSLIVYEPYLCARWFGPDAEKEEMLELTRKSCKVARLEKSAVRFDTSLFSYKWVKEQLEEAHVGKKFIICKEMAFAIRHRLEFMPSGYRHAFLIRHPLRVFPSWKKLLRGVTQLPPEAYQLTDLPTSCCVP